MSLCDSVPGAHGDLGESGFQEAEGEGKEWGQGDREDRGSKNGSLVT